MHFEAVDEVLFGPEKRKVKIVFQGGMVDLEGPELLCQKVSDAVMN
jgi:hypothetical protein